jgi:hypothetical protein
MSPSNQVRLTQATDGTGFYSLELAVGTYDVTASKVNLISDRE